MPKRAQPTSETRQVSFRMPLAVYQQMSEVAEARGIDLSAVLNWICVEHLPHLLQKEAQRKKMLLEAVQAAIQLSLPSRQGADSSEALGIVRELLKQLQDVHGSLSKRALEQGERRAG